MLIDLKPLYMIVIVLTYMGFVFWKNKSWMQRALHFPFIAYIMMLLKETFFPIKILPPEYAIPIGLNNFVPFESIMRIFGSEVPGVALLQIGGNLLLLLPLGFYVSLLWRKVNSASKAFLVGIGVSLFIECLQFILTKMIGQDYRRFDIDDLFLNVMGYMVGYFILKLSVPVIKTLVHVDHLKRMSR
ncbi:glycopeptide antibiotics resistance protein [Croceifilum oryzae]|uniref:Glycopeptide antibiotics resistance protein n=1 Tax=Croceifilum oryzae TaxID=1553429 RepID=A0AAJ1WT48_9BACL|nr:VanZ family protein [Croceifilum oryzae]MDQ0416636.1 glycopeptide antibiotics resistance protein [Croceifilum oryzae]